MRVALVVPSTEPSTGGLGRNVPRLARALREAGIQASVCSVGEGPPTSNDSGAFVAASDLGRRLGRSAALRNHLRESPFDLIHANGLWMAPLGYASSAAAHQQIPLVISPRGMLSPWALKRSRWKKLLARTLIHPGALHAAAGWHVTSTAEEGDVRGLGFEQPVCLAPNGIDPPEDAPGAVRAAYERLAPGIVGKRVLLFYSRFHSKKGVLELIHEFARIAPRDSAWHLLLVGIPEEYSVMHLRAAVRRHRMDHAVSVLDGRNLPAPYALAELMVLPSHSENFGQVVGEALASGLPVITTTDTPWGRINDRNAGACVSRSSIGRSLDLWMSLPPCELRQAGERGRAWVMADFGWSVTAGRLAAFYEALITRGQADARGLVRE